MQPDSPALAAVRAADANRAVLPTPTPRPPLRTLAEYLEDPEALTPPVELVPHLVLQGRVTLFSAREKAGKSTLAGQAVAAVTRGESFLGGTCLQGRVLWYALDEPVGDLVRRLHANGADGTQVFIREEKPTALQVVEDVAESGAALVVIDALSDLLRGMKENDAAEASVALAPYRDAARTSGAAMLLIHHATKGGRGEYRGSSALGAIVDVLASMRAKATHVDGEPDDFDADDQEDDPRRLLEVKGRGIRARVKIAFNGQGYDLGNGANGLPDRILRTLRGADEAMSANDVAKAVGGRRSGVLNELGALTAAGRLHVANGPKQSKLYSLPAIARDDWYPSPVPEPLSEVHGNQSGYQSGPIGQTPAQSAVPVRNQPGTSGNHAGNHAAKTGSQTANPRAQNWEPVADAPLSGPALDDEDGYWLALVGDAA